MVETSAQWSVGQEVHPPKVKPYVIAKLVGEAGNIHVAETGRWHAFWYREFPSGRKVLVHHGGSEGFADLTAVKHQHERVLLRYSGIAVPVSPDKGEKEETMPRDNFGQAIVDMQTLEIPGEQQNINMWIGVLQGARRDLPQARSHDVYSKIQVEIRHLLEGNLGRSINWYKQAAANHLEVGLQGSRAEFLLAINEAELALLLRAHQTVSIWMGTARRFNDVEALQGHWNQTVGRLPSFYSDAAYMLSDQSHYPGWRIERRMNDLIHPTIGVSGLLTELKGEPYFSPALEFINSLNKITQLWGERNLKTLFGVLSQQAAEAQLWNRRVKEQYEGIDFGKYEVANPAL